MRCSPWRLIDEGTGDIFYNLSVEEALARANAERVEKENTLRLWMSRSAVVLGRFQCVHKEVNLVYCTDHGVAVARRFTGGGTVYHDPGNLNFTVCVDQHEPYVTRTLPELYWNFVGAISRGLQQVGVPAVYDAERSCMRIHGRKVSGIAGWVKRGVAFIHGTLLVDSDLDRLHHCLDVPPGQPVYARPDSKVRCLESKRDIVTTIARELGSTLSLDDIKHAVIAGICGFTGCVIEPDTLTPDERQLAEALYRDRYSHPEWNLGVPVRDQLTQ